MSISMPERGLCAHRGAGQNNPENSMAAFAEAVAFGVHMVELDIRLSKDGVPMVFHDSSLDSHANGLGKVKDFTASELKQFRLRLPEKDGLSSECIPTLSDVLAILPLNIWVNIHLKGRGIGTSTSWLRKWWRRTDGLAPGAAVAKVVAATGRQHQVFLVCGPENARAARQVLPQILICHNRSRGVVDGLQYTEQAIADKAAFIQFSYQIPYTTDLIALLESAGIKTTYACTHDLETTRRVLEDGIRFPLVDHAQNVAPQMELLGLKRLVAQMPSRKSEHLSQ
jgi:glycerophosphoryl diester phosphodiesterase